MEPEIYNKSVDTRELQLTSFGDKFTHFGAVGYLLIFPTTIFCFHLFDVFYGNPVSFREGEILVSWGRNRRNENTLIERISEANKIVKT